MCVNSTATPVFPFGCRRPERQTNLILFIVTYGHLLLLVFLVTNIIWLFLMTALTTYGRFPYVSSPTRMTLSLISSLM